MGPFAIDTYLPGFPSIAKSLGVSTEMVSYSLSSYFIGISLGQLLWGPLLDRFGRKKPLMLGLVIFILSSIGCALSNNIWVFVGFRFLQALGGCLGVVAPRAMIRDLFPVHEIAKIFSLLILMIGVSPVVAPTLGGFLVPHLGWHSVFYFLAIFGSLILLAVFFFLPESREADPTYSLKPRPILLKFRNVLRNRQFVVYAFVAAFSSAGLFAYLSGSPFVFMEYFGTSAKMYGIIFSIIAAGLITCSQINNLMLRRYDSVTIIRASILLQMLIGLALFVLTFLQVLNMVDTIVLIAMFLSCQGFTFPNASALSMAPFKQNAGSASALMGALQMGIAAVVSAIVGLMHPIDPVPMAAGMLGCGLLAWLILITGSRKQNFSVDALAE